jgi:hypothetical protein
MCYDMFISSKIYSLQNGIAQNRVVSFLFLIEIEICLEYMFSLPEYSNLIYNTLTASNENTVTSILKMVFLKQTPTYQ